MGGEGVDPDAIEVSGEGDAVTGDTLDAIEARHHQHLSATLADVCVWCHQPWPCDAAALITRVRAAEKYSVPAPHGWQERIDAAEAERDAAHQMMWDALRIMGFDTDGDPTPAAVVGWPNGFLDSVREARKDYDDACDEAEAAEAAEAELAVLRQVIREVDRLHQPSAYKAEIEEFHEDDETYDYGDPGVIQGECPDRGGCAGHLREIDVCQECGDTSVDGELGFIEWPCATHKALAALADSVPATTGADDDSEPCDECGGLFFHVRTCARLRWATSTEDAPPGGDITP